MPVAPSALHLSFDQAPDWRIRPIPEPVDQRLVFDALLGSELPHAPMPFAERRLDVLPMEGLNEHV